MRGKSRPEIRNTLKEGADPQGGYLVPDEFERTLIQMLAEENVLRSLSHVIQTASGDHKIPVVASEELLHGRMKKQPTLKATPPSARYPSGRISWVRSSRYPKNC